MPTKRVNPPNKPGSAGAGSSTARKPLQINPAAVANVANALRGSGLGGGGAANLSALTGGGAMGGALGGAVGKPSPGSMQAATGGGLQAGGGGAGGAGGGDIQTAIANVRDQLSMAPGKPSPMQSLPSAVNGRAGLSPSGLPPRLQQAVDAGRMSAGGAANRYSQFQAGQLPGQQGKAPVSTAQFDTGTPYTPPIYAGGGGGAALKPAVGPGLQAPGAGGSMGGGGGGGLTSAPQGGDIHQAVQGAGNAYNFATGGGLQAGPSTPMGPIGVGEFDFQTGGGLQAEGYPTPPIFNIPGMGDGQGIGGGGIAAPAGGGAKNAYMALLQRRGLAGQGLMQQY